MNVVIKVKAYPNDLHLPLPYFFDHHYISLVSLGHNRLHDLSAVSDDIISRVSTDAKLLLKTNLRLRNTFLILCRDDKHSVV